jgi:mRNA-degrading endonuclease HigB of HigAB toxin-antitoxin module
MMVIPHSERGQIFNFQISLFSLIFIFFVILLPIVGFLILAGYFPAQKASLSLTSYTIEKRIEIAKQTLKQLETEKAEIDNVLKSDRKVVNSIYGNQIRLISQLIGNNFIWGYISGVLSSITGYYLTILLSRIFSKRKVPSK